MQPRYQALSWGPYKDKVSLTHYHTPGKPRGHRTFLLELSENRFKASGPYPIVCRRLVCYDKSKQSIFEQSAQRPWNDKDLVDLAKKFLLSAIFDDNSIHKHLAKASRSRFGKAMFEQQRKGWIKWATPHRQATPTFATADEIHVTILPDSFLEEYWSQREWEFSDTPPANVVAAVEVCA